jgi:hypothetical protein
MPDKRPHWHQSYLGDGVYVEFDGYGIMLKANDHRNPTDKVYLEPDVMKRLILFYERSKIQS